MKQCDVKIINESKNFVHFKDLTDGYYEIVHSSVGDIGSIVLVKRCMLKDLPYNLLVIDLASGGFFSKDSNYDEAYRLFRRLEGCQISIQVPKNDKV